MPMQTRAFGPDGIPVSIMGFGCGAVGGLMVRGAPADQERAVAEALDAGITYFDTAVQYGDGVSESNLGAILQRLGAGHALVGTKVRVRDEEKGEIDAAITASLDASLRRLRRTQVDIFHLHNPITLEGGPGNLSVRQVMEEVRPAFEGLRCAGKLRFLGLTAVGDTAALTQVIDSGAFGSAQVAYNMLNPSAAGPVAADYPAQDYGNLFGHTVAARVGVVGIRVLAGGALSGSMERHAVASPAPAPIGSAHSYEGDVARAARLMPLVREGFAASLPEAAIRFAIAHPAMGSILVGMASLEEFRTALAAVQKGPLPEEALQLAARIAAGFAGESR